MQLQRPVLLLIALGVLAGIFAITGRPRPAPDVEIALDYTSARRFAHRQGYDFEQLLARYRAAGVTSLMISETTLDDLQQQGQMGYPADYPVAVATLSGAEVLARARLSGQAAPAGTDLNESYVYVGHNPGLAAWLQEMLIARVGAGRVRRLPSHRGPADTEIIAVRTGLTDAFLLMPLGIFPPDVAVAQRHGLRVVAALGQGLVPVDPKTPAPVIRTVHPDQVGATVPAAADTVFIYGQEVPGYPDQLDKLASVLRDRDLALAIYRESGVNGTAFPAGLPRLAGALDLKAVKALPVSYRDRVSDWVTAVKDRDFRLIIFPAFILSADGDADVARQIGWLSNFRSSLQAAGFSEFGPALPPAPVATDKIVTMLTALSIGAAAVRLAGRFGLTSPVWAAAGLAAAPLAVWIRPALGAQGLALLAAIVFPAAGAAAALEVPPAAGGTKFWTDVHTGLRMVIQVAGWSLAGGILVYALLLDRQFWLELTLFRGVKIALVAPSIVLFVYWARRQGFSRLAAGIGNAPVGLGHLLLGAAAAGAIMLLVIRSSYAGIEVSGFTIAPVSAAELWLREHLETWFYARPRTKEILIGYPVLMLASRWLRQRRAIAGLVAGGAGAVAGASVVNSFSHAHSPFILSVLRTAHGLWLGAALGVGLLALAAMWPRPANRRDSHG